jgi:hypothetical protein
MAARRTRAAGRPSRRRKRTQAATIFALVVERLRAWTDRRRPSVSRSRNGIALRKHRHSSSQKPGPISDRTVTRRSRPYAGIRWKNGTNKLYRGRSALKAEAASVGGLFHFKPSLRCLLLALSGQSSCAHVCPLLDQNGQKWVLARAGLSAYDPQWTMSVRRSSLVNAAGRPYAAPSAPPSATCFKKSPQ